MRISGFWELESLHESPSLGAVNSDIWNSYE